MKINSYESRLTEMAATVNLTQEIPAAFAELEPMEAYEAIENRLRETRAFLQSMEDVCYEAKRALRLENGKTDVDPNGRRFEVRS